MIVGVVLAIIAFMSIIVIHEFGHYNNAYHVQYTTATGGNNLDVAETQSQGLELLALEYADELYGDGVGDEATLRVLENMTTSVIDGCVFDEFQYRAYTYAGELTVDRLNEIYGEVLSEYSVDGEVDDLNVLAWVGVPHNFEAPMYYISYCVSALASLDLFAMSVEDRQAGVDCYMYVTTYGWETGFRQMLEEVGIPDIFEEENIEDISIAVSGYANGLKTRADRSAALITLGLVFGFMLFVALIVAIAIRSWRKKEMAREEEYRRQLEMHYMRQNAGQFEPEQQARPMMQLQDMHEENEQ